MMREVMRLEKYIKIIVQKTGPIEENRCEQKRNFQTTGADETMFATGR